MSVSAFTSDVTKVLKLPEPFEPHTVTIRKLKPRHRKQAAQEAQRASVEDFRKMGGSQFLKELGSISDAEKKAVVPGPLDMHDTVTLLSKGIIEWSFDKPLEPDSFEDLDESLQDFLAREILALAKPSLFQNDEEEEADTKNA